MSPFFSPPVSEDYSDIIVRRQYLLILITFSRSRSSTPNIAFCMRRSQKIFQPSRRSDIPVYRSFSHFKTPPALRVPAFLLYRHSLIFLFPVKIFWSVFWTPELTTRTPPFVILMAQRGFLASGIRRIKAAHRLRDFFMALPTRANRSTQRFFLPAPAQSYRKQTRRGTVLPSQGLPAEALIRNPTLPAQRLEAVCFSSA